MGPPDLGPRSTLTSDQAAQMRTNCTFKAGAYPGETLASDAPLGNQIPIDNVVVLMMENRSFDNLLANLAAFGVSDADVAKLDATNPGADGKPVARFHYNQFCYDDTNHEWTGSHDEYDNGMNDGFVKANLNGLDDPDGHRAMGYYTEADVPFVYALAKNFAIGDRYFDSLLGPTFPNREYLYAGTSFGYTSNVIIMKKMPTIFDALSMAGVDWQEYYETLPGGAIFIEQFSRNLSDHYDKTAAFFDAAKNGTLPSVSFVDPNLRDEGANHDDEHPPGDIQLGDEYLMKVVNALTASPQWPHVALFITWDENGGLYDHVPPPSACIPDDNAPIVNPNDTMAKFDRYGFRVPIIVVSPYAKPGFVSHVVHDHTSITRFLEARFIIPAMTARDANSDPLFEMFDFTKPSQLTPPSLPTVTVDQAALTACENKFPVSDDGGLAVPDLAMPPDMGM
jgi:phospholipase C